MFNKNNLKQYDGFYTTKKFIGCSKFNAKTKYGYNTIYLPKSKELEDKITALKGKPDIDRKTGRKVWM